MVSADTILYQQSTDRLDAGELLSLIRDIVSDEVSEVRQPLITHLGVRGDVEDER
jgi:hypothetical protein